MLFLENSLFSKILFACDGELRPAEEDCAGRGAGTPLHLCFDGPGERGPAVFGEDSIGADGVEVFGVEEEAVHVEEAGSYGRETGEVVSQCFQGLAMYKMNFLRVIESTCSVSGAAMIAVFDS